ncbi:MAG: DUF6754 domain-containing protein [Candidatus Cloacimonadaceae bacterium]
MKRLLIFGLLSLFLLPLGAQTINVTDVPWDDGKALDFHWDFPKQPDSLWLCLQDAQANNTRIEIPLSKAGTQRIGELSPGETYSFLLKAYWGDERERFAAIASPKAAWFYLHKWLFLLLLLVICGAILGYIFAAKQGKDFFIRRINGLDSMEEAIGRATEKGKPILYVPGIGDLDDIETIASLTILSHLAQRCAEYNTDLIVPCRFSMVLSASREVVREAYQKAGRLDAYKQENIFYLTDDQFGYVAGIDGIMLREEPAANFFLGSFYAESLILAETGFSTGAIQTAGTAQAHQLPFFVVSCDYTLIGEDLFAASAYLSRDPQQLGSLKGHDFGKLLVILLILIGVILEIAGITWLKDLITGALA